MADIYKIIDKLSSWEEIEKTLKDDIEENLKLIFWEKINLEDLVNYNKFQNEFILNKDKILEERLKKLKILTFIVNKKIDKILEKEFFKPTKEYSNYYDPINWLSSKSIIPRWFFDYSKSIFYISDYYCKIWHCNKGIDLLLKFQKWIDHMLINSDYDLLYFLILVDVYKNNISNIKYIIQNYDLWEKDKEKLKEYFNKKIPEWLVDNMLKIKHINYLSLLQYTKNKALYDIWSSTDHEYYWIRIFLETLLFYSPEETKIISDKVMYDVIQSKWKWSKWYNEHTKNINEYWKNVFDSSLNNYIWRMLVSIMLKTNYTKYYNYEKDFNKTREEILNLLN
jgi:hypothetical protein